MKPLALVPLLTCLALASCAVVPPGTSSPSAAAPSGPECGYRRSGTPARAVDPPEVSGVPDAGTVAVTLNLGNTPVHLQLDRAKAPCTVNSFESLVRQGWFTDTTCHRVSTQRIFFLQCGDPSGTGRGGPGYRFDDELGSSTAYPAGVVAMANSGPNTNGSQFFLVFADSELPPRYTVFGTMDAASTQAVADLAFQGHDNSFGDGTGRPNAPATITSVTVG